LIKLKGQATPAPAAPTPAPLCAREPVRILKAGVVRRGRTNGPGGAGDRHGDRNCQDLVGGEAAGTDLPIPKEPEIAAITPCLRHGRTRTAVSDRQSFGGANPY